LSDAPQWCRRSAAFADLLIGAGARPERIFVHRPLLAKLLARACEDHALIPQTTGAHRVVE